MSYKHTLTRASTDMNTHTHKICLPLRIKRAPTYVAAVLADGVRGGPHLPKCRRRTDCGGLMNGGSGLGGGAEETISAMLISPLLLRPPFIPHLPPSDSLPSSPSQSSSPSSHQPDLFTVCPVSLSLFPSLPSLNEFCTLSPLVLICILREERGTGINE